MSLIKGGCHLPRAARACMLVSSNAGFNHIKVNLGLQDMKPKLVGVCPKQCSHTLSSATGVHFPSQLAIVHQLRKHASSENKNDKIPHNTVYKILAPKQDALKSEVLKIHTLTDFDELVAKLHEVVNGVNTDEADQQHVILACLRKCFKEQHGNRLLQHPIMEGVESYIGDKIKSGSVESGVLHAFVNLFVKNTDSDENSLCALLLDEAIRRTSEVSNVKELARIINNFKNEATTDRRKTLLQITEAQVYKQIKTAVLSPSDLMVLSYLDFRSKPEMMEELEASISRVVNFMEPVQVYRVLYYLALNKRTKSFKLISDAKNKLISKPVYLDKYKLRNLFFACATLKIHNELLLRDMSMNVCDLLLSVDDCHSFALPVLMSCNRLGWNHETLMNHLMPVLHTAFLSGKLKDHQKLGICACLARLNVVDTRGLVESIWEDLSDKKDSNPEQYLDLVEIKAMVRKADDVTVQQVLKSSFYKPILQSLADQPVYKVQAVKTKLLNLLGYHNIQLSVKCSMNEAFKQWQEQLREKVSESGTVGMATDVETILNVLAPVGLYTKRNQLSKYGHVIDFEIMVDSGGRAQRLENSTMAVTRVWIKVQDFKDFIKGGPERFLSAPNQLVQEQILADNKHTVFVAFPQWAGKDRNQKINFLEMKIKECIQETQDSTTYDPVTKDATTRNDSTEQDISQATEINKE